MCNHIRPFLLVFPCVALHWPISQKCSRSSCTFPSCFQTQSWSWWMDRHGLQVHGWGRRWRTPNTGLGWTLFSILLRVPGLRLTSRCSQGSGDNILSAPAKVPWISDSWVCFFPDWSSLARMQRSPPQSCPCVLPFPWMASFLQPQC